MEYFNQAITMGGAGDYDEFSMVSVNVDSVKKMKKILS